MKNPLVVAVSACSYLGFETTEFNDEAGIYVLTRTIKVVLDKEEISNSVRTLGGICSLVEQKVRKALEEVEEGLS